MVSLLYVGVGLHGRSKGVLELVPASVNSDLDT